MMLQMGTAELASQADLVVFGTVSDIRRQGNVQVATISLLYVLKGEEGSGAATIQVGFSSGLEDSPVFKLKEKVLLFVRRTDAGLFATVGGSQGKVTF